MNEKFILGKFHCKEFHLNMPADRQLGFCALRFRKGRTICIDCERGKEAAAEVPETDNIIKKEKTMPITKNCEDCKKEYKATGNSQKYCPECKATRKANKPQGTKGGASTIRKKRHGNTVASVHTCEGCEALQMQLDDLSRAEKVMVAAGLVAPEKFEQARKIVRELAK